MKNQTLYWLRLLGFEPDSPPAYLIYVLAFWAFWLFSMWAYLVDEVFSASKLIPLEIQAGMHQAVPILIIILQIMYVIYSLFHDSYKLTAPDINYVVASPVSRGLIALFQYLQAALIPAVLLSLGNCLIEMMLTWHDYPEFVGIAGLKALIFGFGLVYFTIAIGWSVSLLKAARFSWKTKVQLFLALIILLILPMPVNIAMSLSIPAYLVLLVALPVASYLLRRIGNYVHLAAVADRSQTYARIQRLGFVGRIYARSVIDRINRQSRLIKKQELKFSLGSGSPRNSLWQRSILSLLRLSPGEILKLLGRGLFMTAMVNSLLLSMGWHAFQVWLIIAFQFVLMRPSELIGSYGQEMSQSFVSQFLPSNRFVVFITAAALPIFIASWSGSIVVLLMPTPDKLAAIALVILTATAMALCQAMELRKFYQSFAYEYSILAYGLVVIGAGFLTASLENAIIAAFLFNFLFAQFLMSS